ncbi:hypothetical protein AVEN_136282-1 [Araneus ventricosus]|uniref:Uncharacterized protein n=1 Tax=Araneus ventricosus TaxID=182803 RepID=A0A4Y2BEL6_ARAVE|nr:hypothetical protein AVEN_136282-1 [Araneus ventricosus]
MDTATFSVMAGQRREFGGTVALVVRSRLWGRIALGPDLDSTEEPPCMRPLDVNSYIWPNVFPLVWCGNSQRCCQLKCPLAI